MTKVIRTKKYTNEPVAQMLFWPFLALMDLLLVILSIAKNLVFTTCWESLHEACPELNYETLRFTLGDKRRVQGDSNLFLQQAQMKTKAAWKPDISILVKTGHFYFGLTRKIYFLTTPLFSAKVFEKSDKNSWRRRWGRMRQQSQDDGSRDTWW